MSEMRPCWNPLGPDPPKPLPMERQRDHERKEAELYRDQLHLAYQVPPVPLPWEKDKP